MIELGTFDGGLIGFDLATLIETRALIQANSGGGKSWAIRRLLEQSHGKIQQIVLDLEGEFSTLREKYDYILAGKEGDTPAHPKSAKLLARKLLELEVSAICDLYELKAHDRVRFVRYFLESIMSAPRRLYHPVLIIVDEAHHWCPEKGQAESASAIIDLATRGRKRGFCGVLATQRLSKLHKDACAELLNKMVGRASLDIDQKRAADELGLTTKTDRIALRDYRPGEFSAYGPALKNGSGKSIGGVVKLMVGGVQSTHPKVGSRRIASPPAPTDKIKKVLGELTDLPEQADQEAKDMQTLKKENAQLRRELTMTANKQPDPEPCGHETELRELRSNIATLGSLHNESDNSIREILEAISRAVGAGLEKVDKIHGQFLNLAKAQQSTRVKLRAAGSTKTTGFRNMVKEPKKVPPSARNPETVLSGPQQRILDAVAEFESLGISPVNKVTLAGRTSYSAKGGAFGNYLGTLRTSGFIDYASGGVILTEEGRALARIPDTPFDIEELHEGFMMILSGPQRKILQALIEEYPDSMTKRDLADRTGYAESGGAFGNYLGRMRTMGIIDYPQKGMVIASQTLFPEGLCPL